MDNQHRQIKGYRELSQVEIDLMNEIKAMGPQLESLCKRVKAHLESQEDYARDIAKLSVEDPARQQGVDDLHRLAFAQPQRWVAIAVTDYQTAAMALTRAVAQPTFF